MVIECPSVIIYRCIGVWTGSVPITLLYSGTLSCCHIGLRIVGIKNHLDLFHKECLAAAPISIQGDCIAIILHTG